MNKIPCVLACQECHSIISFIYTRNSILIASHSQYTVVLLYVFWDFSFSTFTNSKWGKNMPERIRDFWLDSLSSIWINEFTNLQIWIKKKEGGIQYRQMLYSAVSKANLNNLEQNNTLNQFSFSSLYKQEIVVLKLNNWRAEYILPRRIMSSDDVT